MDVLLVIHGDSIEGRWTDWYKTTLGEVEGILKRFYNFDGAYEYFEILSK